VKYEQWWEAPPFFTTISYNHQEQKKNIQFIIAGSILEEKSYLQKNDQFRAQGSWKLRYLHPKIEGLNFGINGSIQFERSERYFISKDLDSGILAYGDGSNDKYIRTNVDPFVSYTNSKGHRIQVNMRYMDIFRDGMGGTNAVSNQIIVADQYQFRYKNMLVITAGIPFDVGSSRSNLYSGQDLTFHAAAYTQAEFDYKFLSLQGGIRYEAAGVDTNIIAKQPPIFRMGVNLQAAKATFFRASWGQGFRIPSIGEKYIAQQFTGSLYIVPNDTLRAETSWNLELGFKQGFKIKKWVGYFDAAFFWQQSKNFIEYEVGTWANHYGGNGAQIFPDSAEFFPGYILGLKPLNIENTRVAGYELSLAGAGNIGPVGIKLLVGYTYTWPGMQSAGQNYPVGQFIKDMFDYNFKRVGSNDTAKILEARIRHLVRADVELSFWKFYAGVTGSYASAPEKIPPLFEAASIFLFHSSTALSTYYEQHKHGDAIFDVRVGMKLSDQIRLGFIIKNVGNVLYELRPGRAEPVRNYTLQFSYTFGRTNTPKQK